MLQWSLWPYLGGAPYFMYYPALVFAILVGDGATALFVAVIATQFFADPSSELSVEWPRDVVRQTLFVAFGLILMRLGRARNEALRQERIEREKLNAVIQNANVGIGVTDMQGRVLSLNPAGLRIHGFSSESEMFSNLTSTPRTTNFLKVMVA